jgi:putative spermidine/putrescine transport system permease protein
VNLPLRPRMNVIGLLAPALLVICLGLAVPMGSVFAEVIRPTEGPTRSARDALDGFFQSGGTAVLVRTIEVAALTAIVTLLISYPIAYFLYTRRQRRVLRSVIVFLLLSPLFVSVVVRSYAWTLILVPGTGVVAHVPILADQRLLFTMPAIIIGLVNVFVPIMTIAIYASLAQVPANTIRAGQSLGARLPRILRTTIVPLTSQGIVTGVSLVFVLSAASVAIPVLLGGIGSRTMGYMIWQNYAVYADYVTGGVLTIMLALVSLGVAFTLFIVARFFRVPTVGTAAR